MVLLAGCDWGGEKDCAALEDPQAGPREPQAADWCWYERVDSAGQGGDLDKALENLARIQSPMVRSAAIDQLIAARPPGLNRAKVWELCQTLPEDRAATCKSAWDRPHLWEE
jgi:hypothetical protein